MNATLRNFVLMALMVAAAVVAPQLRATTSLADQRPPIDLENMVPRQFGEWREQTGLAMQLVDPEMQASLDRIYNKTLSRTYVNSEGYRIMLSIAYGRDQRDALQAHKPEVCYPAQGFQLKTKGHLILQLPHRAIAATRLTTQLGGRNEPITYWIVLGDSITRGGVDKKIKEMRYSLLHRTIPDGMLVRISSIDQDTARAFAAQEKFASAMVGAISKSQQPRFAGLEQPLTSAPEH